MERGQTKNNPKCRCCLMRSKSVHTYELRTPQSYDRAQLCTDCVAFMRMEFNIQPQRVRQ